MVLEHLFPEEWLERKFHYAFVLGAGYSVIGILLARFLFAADPALPAVAFTSLFLLPELYKLFSIEERQQSRDSSFGVRTFWRDNADFFRVFLMIFLGILLVYCLAAMLLPAFSVNALFREQIEMRGGGFSAAGYATLVGDASGQSQFLSILKNNFFVMLACFVVALLAGDGAIFFITWNASVWGTIFGITARNAAFFSQGAPLKFFLLVFTIVLPHMLLEASSYILAAMAGGLISKGALREGLNGKRFARVFKDNIFILILAITALVIGATVESIVLSQSDTYREIIVASYRALG